VTISLKRGQLIVMSDKYSGLEASTENLVRIPSLVTGW
jgi:hypothetical protein